MKTSLFLSTLALCISTLISESEQSTTLPLVQSGQLRETLLDSELLAKAQVLEDLAYATVERNRVVGSPGHVGTIKYLVDTVSALDYYDVTTQNFTVPLGNSSLNINDTFYESNLMTFSAAGHPIAPLVAVANLGCNSSDYSADVSGSIALILRGTCAFGLKSALAGAAGAAGTIIYNNVEGALLGTLGLASRPEGPYPPTIGISQADGQALLSSLASGPITADLETVLTNVTTYNVIAQTKGGDPENVLHVGAHSDSVTAGPGINDNGSGSIGLLEVAIQLSNFSVNNAVRFSWWSAEEEGLIGATRYVESLSEDELDNIRLYLNFDMIASPNFIYGIYDGDGSAFNVSGPSRSAEAENLFQDYFTNDADLPWTSVDFDGRSDYGPFLDAGIASGGLFTGAEVLKTQEEASIFGGEAGVAYDVNYHASGDNVANLNIDAFAQNTKAIAHAVATYGISFESLPATAENKGKRTNALQVPRQIGDAHAHFHGHGCLADL